MASSVGAVVARVVPGSLPYYIRSKFMSQSYRVSGFSWMQLFVVEINIDRAEPSLISAAPIIHTLEHDSVGDTAVRDVKYSTRY